MQPMLATPASRVPSGSAWSHEVKWDGMRILADVREGTLRLYARSGADATDRFPELAGLAGQYDDMLLDGEVVVLDRGIPSFAALSERIHIGDRATATALAKVRPVTYLIFDLLRLYGTDLTGQPWSRRRELLERLELTDRCWQVPPVYADGCALHRATLEQGLEGVVSKRTDGVYTPGRRSPDWVKVPHRPAETLVVGGWRPETDHAGTLGAVLLGERTPSGALRFVGRVGSGLAGKAGVPVLAALEPLTTDACPFDPRPPRADAEGAYWVRPEVVVEVHALGRGGQGRLRQPSYQRLRTDLAPADLPVVPEAGT